MGLSLKEVDLAIYSKKQKGYSDPTTIDVEELRRDYKERNFIDAQEYLEQKFFKEERVNIKKLDIGRKNLKGSLQLLGFANLEELHCYDNKLTELEVNHLSEITSLHCYNNQLTNLDVSNCNKLESLYCFDNLLKNIKL